MPAALPPPPLAAPVGDPPQGRGWPRISGLGDKARRALSAGGPLALGPGGPPPSPPQSPNPYAIPYDAIQGPEATRFDVAQDPYATRVDGTAGSGDPNATRVDQFGAPNQFGAPMATRADGYPPQSPAGTLIGQLRQATTQPGVGDWGGSSELYRQPPQRRRPPGVLIAGGAAVVIILIAGFILINKSSGGNNTAGASASTSAKASTGTSSQTSATAQKQAATTLAGLLAQSVTDRGDVIDAVVNVQHCGTKLAHDQEVFTKAAGNRDRLLGDLGSMSGRSALSATMLQDLTGAWQSSAAADSDMAKWAGVAMTGCKPKTINSNAYLNASYGPDSTATQDKQAFAKLWNPLAAKFGLTTYSSSQL
jgi:hypothetical protein